MGTAKASAITGPLCDRMANAVPSTPPVIISGGIAAPTFILPINISSNVAPIITPCVRSPSTKPTNGPKIKGLLKRVVPKKYSKCPKTAIAVSTKKVISTFIGLN